MERKEIVNSLTYQATTEAVNRCKTNKRLHIESFVDGAEYGYNKAIDKICEFIKAEWETIGLKWIRGYNADDIIETLKSNMQQ